MFNDEINHFMKESFVFFSLFSFYILEKNNGKLYLNGFFRTYHSGKVASSYIYDLDGIKNAEPWTNPNDFKDRFDIPVPYNSKPVPIQIKFVDSSNDDAVLDRKHREKQKPYTYYSINKDSISEPVWEFVPASFTNANGNKVWAYKVHIEDIETGKAVKFPKDGNYENDNKTNMVWSVTFKNTPYSNYNAYLSELNEIRAKKWSVEPGGLRIVISYKWRKKPVEKPDNPNSKEISDDYTDPQPPNNKLEGVIRADTKGNELFDVEQGIPTTEKTYSYVVGQEYLVSYTFTNYFGIKQYQQVIPSADPKVPPIINMVTRNYSYWKVTQLDVYENVR